MDNEVKIKVVTDTKQAKLDLAQLGQKLQELGSKMTAAFTLPIVGAFGLALSQSKALQQSLVPMRDAFAGVATELGNSLVPVVRDLTPAILSIARALSDAVKWFASLDQGTKNMVVGFAGALALAGPVLQFAGNLIGAFTVAQGIVTGLGTAFTGLGTTIAASLVPVLPLLAAVAGLIALINSEFGKMGIKAGAQLLTLGSAGINAALFGKEAGVNAFYQTGQQLGAFDSGLPVAAQSAAPNIYNVSYTNNGIDMNNPYLKQALAPYINGQLRDNRQR